MNIEKFIDAVKRVLSNDGKVEITNKQGKSALISEEIKNLVNYLKSIQKENIELKMQIEFFNKNKPYVNKLKSFVDDFKVRKSILESNGKFKILMEIHKNRKHDNFIYDTNLREGETTLIELFDIIDKLKI